MTCSGATSSLSICRAEQGWGVAQAVLPAWWMYEDHGRGWEPGIALIEMLATL